MPLPPSTPHFALLADLPVLPVLVGLLVGFIDFLLSLAPLISALVRVLLLQLLPVELNILLELLVLQMEKKQHMGSEDKSNTGYETCSCFALSLSLYVSCGSFQSGVSYLLPHVIYLDSMIKESDRERTKVKDMQEKREDT